MQEEHSEYQLQIVKDEKSMSKAKTMSYIGLDHDMDLKEKSRINKHKIQELTDVYINKYAN